MTGLDCLREEIAARGLPTYQINELINAHIRNVEQKEEE